MAGGNAKSASGTEVHFDVIPLPDSDGPVSLALALPGKSLTRMPGFPKAALPESGRVASGRGLTPQQARMSALGEAAELVSCCAWGDEPLIVASAHELGPAALTPGVLNGFSKKQLDERDSWNARYGGFDWRPPPYDADRPIEWLEVEDAFGGPKAYVPADFTFIGRKEAGDETAVAIGDSNGCACGATLEEAKTAAILELVERDATARWWYGRRRTPLIDVSVMGASSDLAKWLGERARRSYVFDITGDLGIPVIAAVSAEPNGRDVVMGFAARVDIHDAAIHAATEMVQMEFSLAAAKALGGDAGHWAEWRKKVTMGLAPLDTGLLAAANAHRIHETETTPSQMLDACAREGIPIWFAAKTREIIGVPALQAITPVLYHAKPRFAHRRRLVLQRSAVEPVLLSPRDQVPLLI